MKFFKKRIKKVKKAKARVVGAVSEKAASLDPLGNKPEQPMTLENVPKITSESITEHREDVLSGARKYIYPLSHSKHRILVLTSIIAAITIVFFTVYCASALYRFYQYNTFLYRVTQVVPFPVARIGHTFVDYENYLFELRRYVHYYQTQQRNLFGGQSQVDAYRKQALQGVIDTAYVKMLAKQNGVSVNDKDVDSRLAVVRAQNRLGSNDKVFADVLRNYWGWSVSDFRRDLKDQMLAEKLEAKLDTAAQGRAADAFSHVQRGDDFTSIAKALSEDPAAKDNGGNYGFNITRNDPNVPPEVVEQLFKLSAGAHSAIFEASRLDINRPDTLEIVKVLTNDGNTVTAQHISINLKDSTELIKPLMTSRPVHTYVHL